VPPGGGLAGRHMSLNHATVAFNEAASLGGGVFITLGILNLNHAIVAENIAPIGHDITGLAGTSANAVYSLIGRNPYSGLAPAPIGSPDENGNLIGGFIPGKSQ
jgi:hypothetical protein